jgi:hypothetical protein
MQASFTGTFSVITLMRHHYATHATHAARCVAALIAAILLSFSGAARANLAAERQVKTSAQPHIFQAKHSKCSCATRVGVVNSAD